MSGWLETNTLVIGVGFGTKHTLVVHHNLLLLDHLHPLVEHHVDAHLHCRGVVEVVAELLAVNTSSSFAPTFLPKSDLLARHTLG